jgi:THO complex subunit 2
MQEQERVANEEAEKRLKAALTAKREPNTTPSRVSSPTAGAASTAKDLSVEQKPSGTEVTLSEDVSMETDSASARLFCLVDEK